MSKDQPVRRREETLGIGESASRRVLATAIEEARIAPGTVLTSQLLARLGVGGPLDDQDLVALTECGLVEEAGGALKVAHAGTTSIVHFAASSRDATSQ
ncbi:MULTISPECIES: hypothetical protein [unclassified Caballeronia]|uniref:hypothetical protein n=1 Tax=unclassified Caballeronia TaxID=2646786 RepID=UPI002028D99A|nr:MULTISPECIES: hypothetical protein [unclassified Caballeronia]